jgi:hypothetical protein
MSYWVVVVARNAETHIGETIQSLLAQTLQPKRLVVIDDGSRDGTRKVLSNYEHSRPDLVTVVTLPDRGYDIRRVPSNINLAWNTASGSGVNCEYFMISGDDCAYSGAYAKSLMSRIDTEKGLAVASGRPNSSINLSSENSPSGSGRLISCSFWREIGEKYPVKAGWETWLLYEAVRRGYTVRLCSDIVYEHVRARGAKHQFIYWGAAMHSLGYHPAYALGRIAKNVLARTVPVIGSLNMLRGYIQSVLGSVDPFVSPFDRALREFVYRNQVRRMTEFLRGHVRSFI